MFSLLSFPVTTFKAFASPAHLRYCGRKTYPKANLTTNFHSTAAPLEQTNDLVAALIFVWQVLTLRLRTSLAVLALKLVWVDVFFPSKERWRSVTWGLLQRML